MRDDVILPPAPAAGHVADDPLSMRPVNSDLERRLEITREHADIVVGLRRHRPADNEPFGDPALTLWVALDLLANDSPRESVMAVICNHLRGHIAQMDARRALAHVETEGNA